ncbi:radial spoke head 1 homolog [Exaiptasia diaphana]|uniref:Uncharacterized protein n=1 Tax=Exaiptasia diaphana TaxID=2652724 RepID=A0A913X766_EXADI|nr:radial spoke head 1 homolog [Exaiptasia diaphana]KXJ14586.1 Phosphatidylinositol 4-phosphate 5-kinase 5 [Exaiptasia diaphana]
MGANPSKDEPRRLTRESETENDTGFEDLGRYQGAKKDGKRHGQGIYFFDNGDIYDGEWRKGRKEGFGTYQFSDGNKNIGWFYRDQYVGKEPNEKLKWKMKKHLLSAEQNQTLNNAELSQPREPKTTELNSQSDEEIDDKIPKLKDPTTLDLRRAESMRRQQFYRAKYNIPDKNNDPETAKNDAHGLRESIRAKWGLKRSKSCSAGTRRKDPRLLTKEEEQLERERSKQQREAIRARYNLH